MDWLNYHHLMNFWLVAREGSIQGASEILHVTPASVSIQVRKLEKSLGVKLLRKEGRGVTVTDIGRQVAEYAETIFSTGRELQEMVRGQPVGRPLILRVGVREVMPKVLAFKLIQPAISLAQPVKLICVEGKMSALVADLAIHKLDLVLSDSAIDPLFRVQVHSHRLGESDVIIVGPPSLAGKYQTGFPQSLEEAPFLMPTTQNVLRRQLDQWFASLSITPHVTAEIADSAMMKIAGRAGLGLLAVPAVIENEIKEIYGLVRVGLAEDLTEQFYGISAARKITHPAVIAMRDAAKTH